MTDEDLMPFGKFKGEKMANVPTWHLLWLFDTNKCYGTIKQYIKDNEEILRQEIEDSK